MCKFDLLIEDKFSSLLLWFLSLLYSFVRDDVLVAEVDCVRLPGQKSYFVNEASNTISLNDCLNILLII